jgi:hypothetical protein
VDLFQKSLVEMEERRVKLKLGLNDLMHNLVGISSLG